MPTLPTGVVTFLFSDIEASTRILEDHPSVAGRALARHLELVAAEIAAADGVVFETVGDAVYGAFDRPADALTAAVAIQRATAAEDWGEIGALRVRIAVHAGAVETRATTTSGRPSSNAPGSRPWPTAPRRSPRRRRGPSPRPGSPTTSRSFRWAAIA